MKIVVVGLGSMGRRRIRLMRAFFPDVDIVGVDPSKSRRAETSDAFGTGCFPRFQDAADSFYPDCGFVCSPPLTHAAVTGQMLRAGLHVFSEINLVSDGYGESEATAREKGLTLFLSSTPMYRKEIEYITSRTAGNGALRYRYHVGQYLPDWHPWENYRDFFVGDRRTSGCRELFAIELPWLIAAFGSVEAVSGQPAKLAGFDVDCPDCFCVSVTHAGGAAGQLMVDVVSRKAVRDLEVVGTELYLRWGGTPESLRDYDIVERTDRLVECYSGVTRDPRYADNIIEDAYVSEIADFFDAIAGKSTARHSFARDYSVLALIDKIEGRESPGD